METELQKEACIVPPLVRQRVDAAVRECWLALQALSECYLDCEQMPKSDLHLFGVVTAHRWVQERLGNDKGEYCENVTGETILLPVDSEKNDYRHRIHADQDASFMRSCKEKRIEGPI